MPSKRSSCCGLAVALVAAGLLLPSCASNRHHAQSGPRVTRVVTIPGEATLTHVGLNQEWITPCDFTASIDLDDEIVVSKKGYRTFRGTIRELKQVAAGTYQLELEPVVFRN